MPARPTTHPTAYGGRLTALLGPTNTGKTHHAIETMLQHHTGCIGFPLRLLARENYDRVVAAKGAHAVALVTGEEKIIPRHARYYLCTVESMPVTETFDFLAVDEIQLAADDARGHIFTDRLLRARGRETTIFLGADTIAPLIRQLLPDCIIDTRPRLSVLAYQGFQKLTRLPRRSAIVTFSVEEVYRLAEIVKRQKGGTAIVLGALSPRTRNAQVALYQSGEVDYLVATDAIGMGLNMDIQHVALAATRKWDGHRLRHLKAAEMAQIAGRAGRYKKDGTFGVTGPVSSLDREMVEAIESHSFPALDHLIWRNAALDFADPKSLLRTLEAPSHDKALQRGPRADDVEALSALMRRDDVMALAEDPEATRLLWDVCQIPDFRKTLGEAHQELLATIYTGLLAPPRAGGVTPLSEDWVASQIDRLDKTEGDVDTLMTRIAHIRTWTYISHKRDWLKDALHWQERSRSIEDKLSDALHEALTARFVDRRNAVLMRGLKDAGKLLGGVRPDGSVVVEGHVVGQLRGFQFIPEQPLTSADAKVFLTAARHVLKPEVKARVMALKDATDKQFRLQDDGTLLFQSDASNPLPGQPLARVTKGASILSPEIVLLETDLLAGEEREAVLVRLQAYMTQHIATTLAPLIACSDETAFSGAARGIAFQVYEGLGTIPRSQVEDLLPSLDPDSRKQLRDKGVRLGPLLIYLPLLNKPASVRLRALLWSLWNGKALPAPVPHDGAVSMAVDTANADPAFYRAIGYPLYGPRVARIDMLDRVVTAIYDSAKDGKFQAQHKMAEWLGCSIPDLYAVISAMGHRLVHDPANDTGKVSVATPAASDPDHEQPVPQPTEPESPVPGPSIPETPVPHPHVPESPVPGPDVPETPVPGPSIPETPAPFETPTPSIPNQPLASAAAPKPELATFALRKGKAHADRAPRAFTPRTDRAPRPGQAQGGEQSQNSQRRDGKSFRRDRAEGEDGGNQQQRRAGGPPQNSGGFRKKKPQKPVIRNEAPRSFSAPSKTEAEDSNPFAILKQLNIASKD
jgi:ATP-dependent RNA helicase SUPV3L1/SUV3